ncbi:hypothetical protein, partial [Streptomyces virginiae]|uniref:hypothetical protein n=1 Tax=Streptomyces virginiae TaxID=1961 RepID=UPI0033213E59
WNNSHNSSGTSRSTIPTTTDSLPNHPNEMTSYYGEPEALGPAGRRTRQLRRCVPPGPDAREEAGDQDGAEAVAQHAAEHGDTHVLYRLYEELGNFTRLWPYGLDPDGAPTTPWRLEVPLLTPGSSTLWPY